MATFFLYPALGSTESMFGSGFSSDARIVKAPTKYCTVLKK